MGRATDRQRQGGFTLIELVIVLAAIGVLVMVINMGVGTINTGRLSTAERDIRTLYSAATAWAAQQANPTYGGVSISALKTAGILPTNVSGNNPWGNAYTVSGTITSLTVASDVSSAANCTTLSARLAPASTSASCASATLTVTF